MARFCDGVPFDVWAAMASAAVGPLRGVGPLVFEFQASQPPLLLASVMVCLSASALRVVARRISGGFFVVSVLLESVFQASQLLLLLVYSSALLESMERLTMRFWEFELL